MGDLTGKTKAKTLSFLPESIDGLFALARI